MTDVIFDGKWTFKEEWKNSSEYNIHLDDGEYLQLKSAHQGNFVYFLIDFVTDTNEDPTKDKAMICLDTQNDKTEDFDKNDYCFVIIHQESSYILVKDLELTENGLKKNHSKDFVGISNMSDKKDRYSPIPHMTYEFKIPIDIIGRSDSYGLYLSVYDDFSNKTYGWPVDSFVDSSVITSPLKWGNLISPDKSIPEFENIVLIVLPAFLFIMVFSSIKKKNLFHN
jgi:hypothetical protein